MKQITSLFLLGLAIGGAQAQTGDIPFTLISQVREAGPKVVALAIDFGKPLPINWRLDQALSVTAELKPVLSYAGDVIANSAAASAPRSIRAAYTSYKPEVGSPSEGRFVIVEMDADDTNAGSWYSGFNPSIRQMIPYQDKMRYQVTLKRDLNLIAPNVSATQPSGTVETVKAGASFRQAGARVMTVDKFSQAIFEMQENVQTKRLGYNFYRPIELPAGAKIPLVVFLHGSGQSHDYKHFPSDLSADVLSPVLANQGGTAWIERGPEKTFVLVPQAPARDTRDKDGEGGWRGEDTQKLLLALVDKIVEDNPAIDTSRLYLSGLSMGALGSWKIISHPNPAISRKFAAAALFNGAPKGGYAPKQGETLEQATTRYITEVEAMNLTNVSIPLWLTHADKDPTVSVAGARVPFALLTGKATVGSVGELVASHGALKSATPLVRHYQASNAAHPSEVRYTEYQYGSGDAFRDLGMATRHAHFSWEASFKDQAIIDWMFAQRKR